VTNSGIALGGGAGQVTVTPNGTTGYTIVAHSKSTNNFTITKSGANITRACSTSGKGACPAAGTW
jgi:hypothetical protein